VESPSDKSELVLSFDLGGGTFDLSLMAVTGDSLEVVAYGGDMHLGGQDFDYNLQQWFIKVGGIMIAVAVLAGRGWTSRSKPAMDDVAREWVAMAGPP